MMPENSGSAPAGDGPATGGGEAAEAAPANLASHDSLPSDVILGDVISTADDANDLSDLHAALLSLSNDTFAYLDVALDHLTSSSDLFDVPAIDHDDISFDDSGA